MEYLLSVMLFAISSSVTPGPNNIMVMSSGVNFGTRKSLPLLTGICVGFALMLVLVGLGFGQLFDRFPALHLIIKCIGTLYLLYLAWLIANASGEVKANEQSQPLSFMNGLLFQWVNAKAWVVATGAIAAFTTVGAGFYSQNLTIATIFLIVSFPCVGVWLMFGAVLKRHLKQAKHRVRFNYAMSILLVISVVPVVAEIIKQLAR